MKQVGKNKDKSFYSTRNLHGLPPSTLPGYCTTTARALAQLLHYNSCYTVTGIATTELLHDSEEGRQLHILILPVLEVYPAQQYVGGHTDLLAVRVRCPEGSDAAERTGVQSHTQREGQG